MGMTIEDCINYYNKSFAIGNTDDDRQHNDILEMTIDTMRRYQKIQEIYLEWNRNYDKSTSDAWSNVIGVLEDGNVD